jgi:hypothetical protein
MNTIPIFRSSFRRRDYKSPKGKQTPTEDVSLLYAYSWDDTLCRRERFMCLAEIARHVTAWLSYQCDVEGRDGSVGVVRCGRCGCQRCLGRREAEIGVESGDVRL